MCVVYTILTGVWSAEYNTTDISFNSPRFLPDGLLLTGGGDTRTQIATWTVLITIARPYEIAGLHTKLDFFNTTIEKLRGVHEMANDTIVRVCLCKQRKYGFSLKRSYHNFSTIYLNSQQEPRCFPLLFGSKLRRNITYQNVETMCCLRRSYFLSLALLM